MKSIDLDNDVEWILGLPNFKCGALARSLRNNGHTIKEKAEAEQAYVIHFLLNLYLTDRDTWRSRAEDKMGLNKADKCPNK